MSATTNPGSRRLRGGIAGPLLVGLFGVVAVGTFVAVQLLPRWSRDYGQELAFDRAMFAGPIEQPIAFSHRLHATDKAIDCNYCHDSAERSPNAGVPAAAKCLGCHDHIIPHHTEIETLKGFVTRGEEVPWVRVYHNPDHVYFPHFRHLTSGVRCQECHGDVERVDRLRKVTFYMGFCLDCHTERDAPRTCVACHQ